MTVFPLSSHVAEGRNDDPMLLEHTGQDEPKPANPRQYSTRFQNQPEFCRESTPGRLQCSFFAHARDNRPRPWAGSWEALKTGLGRVFNPQAGNPGGTPKQSMPAICAASFAQGSTRGRDAVQGVSLLILDFDNAREEATGTFYPSPSTGEPSNRPRTVKVCIDAPVTPGEVHAVLSLAGVASVGWTTWSCTPEHPKHRWIVPLAQPVPVDPWERAATMALSILGLDPLRRGLDVPVLHNAAALAFLPGSPDPDSIQRFETLGAALDIPLDELPPLPAPPLAPWQAEVIAERQAERAKGEHWFQSYRVGGRPVEFQTLDLASILEAHGVMVGPVRPFKSGTKRRAHCPWAGEHTKGLDDDSVVLIQTPGTWPSFKCSHSGHRHLGLRDLIEWAWGTP